MVNTRFLLLLAPLMCVLSLRPSYGQDESNDELVTMVIEFLSDSDKDIRALALEQIRTEAPGEAATQKFAAELSKLPPGVQVELLRALADRGDTTAKSAVLDVLKSASNTDLKEAAIQAIGKLGDGADVDLLVDALSSSESPVATAARQSLVRLQGEQVVPAIVSKINARDATSLTLITVLADRRALDATATLLELAVGPDAERRMAAMNALGELAGPEHVAKMAQAVLVAEPGRERSQAEKNLMFVCNRIDDADQRALPLLDAMKSMSDDDRMSLLSTLGRIGGAPALEEVDRAIDSRDSTQHSQGIRAIANWPDASIAERMVSLIKSDGHPSHQRTLRMALIRIAPLPDGRTDAEKLALLERAMSLAANDQEKKYALQRAAAIRLPETLRFVLPYLDQPAFTDQACQTIVELAHDRGLRDSNKDEFHAALDKVLELTDDATLMDRANRYKKGQTWVRPK